MSLLGVATCCSFSYAGKSVTMGSVDYRPHIGGTFEHYAPVQKKVHEVLQGYLVTPKDHHGKWDAMYNDVIRVRNSTGAGFFKNQEVEQEVEFIVQMGVTPVGIMCHKGVNYDHGSTILYASKPWGPLLGVNSDTARLEWVDTDEALFSVFEKKSRGCIYTDWFHSKRYSET
jgi:hypothetical protein